MPLLRLPNETLLQISGYLIPRHLSPLLRANKRLYFLLQSNLQKLACKKIYAYAALYCAAIRGDESMVRFLLQEDTGISLVNENLKWKMRGVYSTNDIQASGLSGEALEDMIKYVLGKGANLLLKDDYDPRSYTRTDEDEILDGSTYNCPIFAGAGEDHYDHGRPALESYGFRNTSRTALHWAIIHKHKALLDLVLKKGANLDYQDGSNLETALHEAAFWSDETALKLLLENGANQNIIDSDSRTPLHFTAYQGSKNGLLVLLEYGGDILRQDRYGRTVYDIVSKGGLFEDSFCIFMKQKFEQAQHEKEMAFEGFFKAVEEGDFVTVKKHLDKNRYDVNKKLRGMTPIQTAAGQLNKGMINLLLECGASSPEDWRIIQRYYYRGSREGGRV